MAKSKQLSLFDAAISATLSADEIYAKATRELLATRHENRLFERKPGGFHAKALGEYISMWSNTKSDGGLIVVGVENDGQFSGCARFGPQHINNLEKAAYNFCPDAKSECKRVEFEQPDGTPDFAILYRVKYHPDKLVRHVNGKAYKREGDSKVEIKDDECREIEADKGQRSFECEDCGLKYPDEFSEQAIQEWIFAVAAAKNGKAASIMGKF
jgi:ATP-dependent DNA helicase RecG